MSGDKGAEAPDPRHQLVLDEARRGIDHQVRDLDGLRGRASALAALSMAAGTFLAGILVNQHLDPNCATWAGFGALALAILLCLNQLRPHTFSFTLSVSGFDERAFQDDINTFLRAASSGLDEDAKTNQKTLDCLFRQYVGAVVLFVAGAATTVISLVGR